ncbi:MAG TPA: serine hydrolase [Bryobacteraceae bacterium]|nr:serine hydrolase [Bryobacteraceae bacterium]
MVSKVCAVFLLVAGSVAAQDKPDGGLDSAVKARIAGFPGTVTIAAKNLATGRAYALGADQPVRTASTIKLPIMIECFYEASEGKLKWTEPIKLTEEEKVTGTGVLQDLSAGDELPFRDVVDLMIVLSDNTATNLILNRISGNAVNARMAQLGLQQTRVMRKILGDGNKLKPYPSGITDEGAKPENKKWGLGRSSPQEMLILLEKLYRGELVNKQASDEMLAIMKRQRDHNCIGRDMKDVPIASKSGSLDHLRSDVGIIYSKKGPIAMAITVEDIPEIDYGPDNVGDLLISALSEILVNGLGSPH